MPGCGLLTAITIPLTIVLLAKGWLRIDTGVGVESTWDGRVSQCANTVPNLKVVGILDPFNFYSCNAPTRCTDNIDTDTCGLGSGGVDGGSVQSLATSAVSPATKAASALAAALVMLTLVSQVILLLRSAPVWWCCVVRLQDPENPNYVGWVHLTRLQLFLQLIFIAVAVPNYYNVVPAYFKSLHPGATVEPDSAVLWPNDQIWLAHVVLTATALLVVCVYGLVPSPPDERPQRLAAKRMVGRELEREQRVAGARRSPDIKGSGTGEGAGVTAEQRQELFARRSPGLALSGTGEGAGVTAEQRQHLFELELQAARAKAACVELELRTARAKAQSAEAEAVFEGARAQQALQAHVDVREWSAPPPVDVRDWLAAPSAPLAPVYASSSGAQYDPQPVHDDAAAQDDAAHSKDKVAYQRELTGV